MAQIAETMPTGYAYKIAFDTSDFVRASIKEVFVTLLIAILLVVLVIFIFLQNWHSTLIPSITIPVSLIGTFAAMKLLGFSINTLTLFGLTLATGLVVDDAIVVLENIVRHIVDDKSNPFRGNGASDARDRRRRRRHVARADVGIRSGRLPAGHHRPALPAVRADDGRRRSASRSSPR